MLMIDRYSILFDRPVPSQTVALVLVTLLSFVWLLWRTPPHKRLAVLDVCIAATIGGIVAGRLAHVTINQAFFSERIPLIWQLSQEGGLTWQIFVVGALLTGFVVARWHEIGYAGLLRSAAVLLPLIAFVSWYGCAATGCAYGQPVERMADYPAWLTWIAPDIYRLTMPRFATQAIGMTASGVLFVFGLLLHLTNSLPRMRFPLLLVLIAIVSFTIGFLRGDPAPEIATLRIGQWLDLILIVCTIPVVIYHIYQSG